MSSINVTDPSQAACAADQRSCCLKNVGVKLAWLIAAAFAGAAIVGFVPNPLLGSDALFVTNTAHNLVHLVTAVAFAVAALMGHQASTRLMLAFGPVYALVGLIGFAALGSASEGHLFGIVHINLLDNFLHVGLGVAIGAAGLFARSKSNRHFLVPQTCSIDT